MNNDYNNQFNQNNNNINNNLQINPTTQQFQNGFGNNLSQNFNNSQVNTQPQYVQQPNQPQQPIQNGYGVNNDTYNDKQKKNKRLLIIGIIGVLIVLGAMAVLLLNKQKTEVSKPTDATDSAVVIAKTQHGNYYLKENINDFVAQLKNYKYLSSTIDLDSLDKIINGKYAQISFYDKDDFGATHPILKLDLRTDKENAKLEDLSITSFNILEGTIELKTGKIEINKTKIDEVMTIFGENNLQRKNESLELYTFVLSQYKMTKYSVYCNNGIVTNIVVSN